MFLKNINYTPVNFTSISLNNKEKTEADKNLKKVYSSDSQAAKNNLLQIFDKHIIKEVESKYSFSPQKDDYLQAYYTALFDAIDQKMTLDGIIEFVNKPDFKSNIVHSKYSNECLISGHKLKLLTEDDLPQYASAPDEEKVLHYKDKLDKVSVNLTSSQYEALRYMAFHDKYNQTKQQQAKIAIAKIQKEKNVLPEKYYVKAKKLQDVIWRDKDIDAIVDLLIHNQMLLSLPVEKIKYNIENSSKVLNNSKLFFSNPRLICINPEVIENKIDTGAEKFGVTREKYISMIERNPSILTYTPDCLYNRAENGAKVLNLPLKNYIGCILVAPRLFMISAENLSKYADASSEILGITREQFINAGVKFPEVFSFTPDLVEKKAKAFSEILGTNNIGKVFMVTPILFARDIETIKNNKEHISEILEISPEQTIKLLRKSTNILLLNSKTIDAKIDLLAKELNTPRNNILKALKKCPNLVSCSVESIKSNIDTVVNALSLSKEDYIESGVKFPSILVLKPEKVINNVTELADWFGKTKEEMAKILLAMPSVATLQPQTVINNVENLVKLFKDDKIRQKVLREPVFMQMKPETVYHKYSLQKYYKLLSGFSFESLHIPKNKDEYFYLDMLRLLISKANNIRLSKLKPDDCKSNLISFINSNPDYNYNFKIPDDGYIADELIKFTHDFCEENFGKQIIYVDKSN